jgi:hypothetical protein
MKGRNCIQLKVKITHTGCVRDRDLKKYRTPDFLGFFGFVKTIKLLMTQKNQDTSTKSQLGHDAQR